MKRVYPFEIFPSVWDKISELAIDGILISCEDVYEELNTQDDELVPWADEHLSIFKPIDIKIQIEVAKILGTHSNLLDLKNKKSSADPFIIAVAKVNDCIVVTEEQPSGGPHKSKIPDVCRYYGIRCIKLLDILAEEGLRI
jgi:hypothetical protein